MANGITLGGLEVQGSFASNGLRFTFRGGDLQSLAAFVGEDDDVPGAAGQHAGVFTAHHRDLALHGLVSASSGADAQALRESFRVNAAALIAKMNPAQLITIVAYPPNFGLATGTTATLANCRPMSIDGPSPGEVAWYEAWEVTLRLRCIDSPPDWVVA